MKNLVVYIITFLLVVSCTLFSPIAAAHAQDLDVKGERVEYLLPFPGLLPDNPLYTVKVFRDRMWLFLTRDNMKKAELLLLFSDKKTSAAQALAKKGKWDMGSDMMLEAEQDFKTMVATLVLSQEVGIAWEDSFKMNVILSNKKHREVIEDLLSNTPQGSHKILEDAVELNSSLTDKLQELFQ